MPVPLIRPEADRLPKGNTRRRGIRRDQLGWLGTRQQRHRQLPANAAAAEGWPDVKAAHAQGARHDRFNRKTADASEHPVYARR